VHPQRTEGLEFDYPQEGQQYVEYAYQGKGGVPLFLAETGLYAQV